MVTILDKLLEFFSSLKLAIFLILSLAFYLGSATCYEARYGTRAVQEIIYASRPFVLLMALLAINVMAAVLVRYPWKRKQTGFIITHAGIEILLLGCLISFRFSVDGRVSLQPHQQPVESINLNDEEVGVTMADGSGQTRRTAVPIQLWSDAGYPGLAHFVLGSLSEKLPDFISQYTDKLVGLPPEPRWPQGHTVDWQLGGTTKLTILDWMPAAVPQTLVKAIPDGVPTVNVHLGGQTPNGMPMDQDIPIMADNQGNGMVRPFGGKLELDIWKARSADEVAEFTNPPEPKDLPEMGRVDVFLSGKRYAVNFDKDSLQKPQPLGDSGYTATPAAYTASLPPPQLPEGHGAEAIPNEPVNPEVEIDLSGPKGTHKYLMAAWHPQVIRSGDADATDPHAGMGGMAGVPGADGAPPAANAAGTDDAPFMWYWNPRTYVTTQDGTLGRLWMLVSPDGKLYGRMFQLPQADNRLKPPFELKVGDVMEKFWANFSLAITQYQPSGTLYNDFRPAHVDAKQMDDHARAIRVALDVDGSHQEAWLERAGPPVELNTPRGPVQLDYGFHVYTFAEGQRFFTLGLDHAEQTNDPGSNAAAAYTSEVTISGTGQTSKQDGPHIITMNEPLTVQGLTFYQAGFDEDDGTSTLSIRFDPGRWIKYLGCAMIVGGIFTMFYMKAYFQKSPVSRTQALAMAETAAEAEKSSRPAGGERDKQSREKRGKGKKAQAMAKSARA